tara:strand:+ start:2349 stop:2882 length:534 start_codon:yes stop_codon:yes gene_type:complete
MAGAMSLAASISHTQQLERAEAPQSVSISANSGGQAGLAEGFSQNEAASSSRRRRHGPAVMRGGTAGQPEQRHVMTRESRLLAKACVELLNEKKGPPAACLGIYNYGARLRRSSVAAALRAASASSQQRCAQHQLRRSSISSVADATHRMSAMEQVCAAPSQQRLRRRSVAVALRAL